MHKVKIYQRTEGQAMTGLNTIVELDGKKLDGVTKVTFEVSAGNIAKISLEMIGEINIDANIEDDIIPPV